MLKLDRIGANLVNIKALEDFNLSKSLGAQRTSTRSALSTFLDEMAGTVDSLLEIGALVGVVGSTSTLSILSRVVLFVVASRTVGLRAGDITILSVVDTEEIELLIDI